MPRGNTYFLLLVDDLSRYVWVASIPSKDHAAATIKDIQARVKGESGLKLRVLHPYHKGVFTVTELMKYCATEVVHRQHIAPYSPQQYDIIESQNGEKHAQGKRTTQMVLGEALSTTVYVLNRCPMKTMNDMTPFEAWHGKKPMVHLLRIFGCIVYVWNTAQHLKKLEDRGCKIIFIGYERRYKAYHAYNPVTKRVHMTRDTRFTCVSAITNPIEPTYLNFFISLSFYRKKRVARLGSTSRSRR
jgi:hypothetical protein